MISDVTHTDFLQMRGWFTTGVLSVLFFPRQRRNKKKVKERRGKKEAMTQTHSFDCGNQQKSLHDI
jgi:hypothetical protein